MQFDTDVLIWFLRGNEKAAGVVDRVDDRRISVITYMELLQGARNKEESKTIKRFLADFSFLMAPLTQNHSCPKQLFEMNRKWKRPPRCCGRIGMSEA
jgi:predicted nucleic acid-binding protein